MKFFHLSDLHLGKRLNGFSLIEDQKYILDEVVKYAETEKPDAVVVAGDVYDSPVPSAEATALLDYFFRRIGELDIKLLVISGNHDSAERLSINSWFTEKAGLYCSPVYDGEVKPAVLEDEYGTVSFYLLPFLKPASIRSVFREEAPQSSEEAVRYAISLLKPDTSERNVIISHQFVMGASRCDSEEPSPVGGLDGIDVSVFDEFDYAALGHIHGPQNIGRDTVRYCGTPLKYSFSECNQEKSVTVVEMREKGDVTVSTLPLNPIRDMREIKGTFNTLTSLSSYSGTDTEDYIHVILTDEDDVLDAMNRLRCIYPNIVNLEYDNTRTRSSLQVSGTANDKTGTPLEIFSEFFEMSNGRALTEEQKAFCSSLIEEIWGGEA